ncbi:MAG: hypothetical protein ACRDJK_06795 [Actinomycetota bacterium]
MMRLRHPLSQLLVALPLVAGLAGGAAAVPAENGAGQAVATPSIGERRPSLPMPVHDEATCAFCQAAIFPLHIGSSTAAVPTVPEALEGENLSSDARIGHCTASRPPSSRAPPTLHFA